VKTEEYTRKNTLSLLLSLLSPAPPPTRAYACMCVSMRGSGERRKEVSPLSIELSRDLLRWTTHVRVCCDEVDRDDQELRDANKRHTRPHGGPGGQSQRLNKFRLGRLRLMPSQSAMTLSSLIDTEGRFRSGADYLKLTGRVTQQLLSVGDGGSPRATPAEGHCIGTSKKIVFSKTPTGTNAKLERVCFDSRNIQRSELP
jgi:hypothetical protein